MSKISPDQSLIGKDVYFAYIDWKEGGTPSKLPPPRIAKAQVKSIRAGIGGLCIAVEGFGYVDPSRVFLDWKTAKEYILQQAKDYYLTCKAMEEPK